MAFTAVHYQRISSEEDILDEDLPPTVVSTRTNDERGVFNYNSKKTAFKIYYIVAHQHLIQKVDEVTKHHFVVSECWSHLLQLSAL